jgi:VanZ family protein
MNRAVSRDRRRWLLILYWIAMFLATHWPDIDRYAPEQMRAVPHLDKLVHFGMYAGWMLMWGWLLSAGGRRIASAVKVWLLVGGAAWGAFDELTQAFVDRQPSVGDFACDLAGITAALVLLTLWRR